MLHLKVKKVKNAEEMGKAAADEFEAVISGSFLQDIASMQSPPVSSVLPPALPRCLCTAS